MRMLGFFLAAGDCAWAGRASARRQIARTLRIKVMKFSGMHGQHVAHAYTLGSHPILG
jgi:hypothetical protein